MNQSCQQILMAPRRHKPHAVLVPFPAQSHIKAFLKFAKLLHRRGFHITFVNTEFNHRRLLRSHGASDAGSLDILPDFRFEAIPDGLPPSDPNATQDLLKLMKAIVENSMGPPFIELVKKLINSASSADDDDAVPPVSCIVSDGAMPLIIDAARELGVPCFSFFTVAASFLVSMNYDDALRQRSLTPLKDESFLTNGFLETTIDWIPGIKEIKLRESSSFITTSDQDDMVIRYLIETAEKTRNASAVILHTFDALETDVLCALSSIYSRVYAIGPLQLLLNEMGHDHHPLNSAGYSLWKEEEECLKWLETQEPNSVLYINFGSIVEMALDQLVEFATGLVNSNCPFLWIIRSDTIEGNKKILVELLSGQVTKGRGFIASWCAQEEVLNRKSIGGFVTHCGWNSVVESLTAGVPMLCWPRSGDQYMNAWLACRCLGVGLEIESDVKRQDATRLVKDLMGGAKGKEMRQKMEELRLSAYEAVSERGSSRINLDLVVDQMAAPIKD